MRISDWSSDVCSSDLPWSLRREAIGNHTFCRAFRCNKQLDAAMAPFSGFDKQSTRGWDCALDSLGHSGSPQARRSEEHTSELQSLMRISYAVFCLKKKITKTEHKQ